MSAVAVPKSLNKCGLYSALQLPGGHGMLACVRLSIAAPGRTCALPGASIAAATSIRLTRGGRAMWAIWRVMRHGRAWQGLAGCHPASCQLGTSLTMQALHCAHPAAAALQRLPVLPAPCHLASLGPSLALPTSSLRDVRSEETDFFCVHPFAPKCCSSGREAEEAAITPLCRLCPGRGLSKREDVQGEPL